MSGRLASSSITASLALLLALCTTAADALLVGARPTLLARPMLLVRSRPILLSEDGDEDKGMSDDALAAAFAARLEKEGGATQFKIKTTLTGAADELKDATSGVASTAADGLADAKDAVVSGSPVALIGGLFAAVILFTVVSSIGRQPAQVDRYSSDGTNLEFGQRSTRDNSAYQPQLGVGTFPQ